LLTLLLRELPLPRPAAQLGDCATLVRRHFLEPCLASNPTHGSGCLGKILFLFGCHALTLVKRIELVKNDLQVSPASAWIKAGAWFARSLRGVGSTGSMGGEGRNLSRNAHSG
jgi:hypothetical protein